jgi:hypothetical protein
MPLIEPRRPPGLANRLRQASVVPRHAPRHVRRLPGSAPRREVRHQVVRIVTRDARQVGAEQPADLRADRPKKLIGRHAVRDQRRDAPQGSLLIGEAGRLRLRLGIGDRRREQLGEVGQARLAVRRELGRRRRDDHRAPHAPRRGDRNGHRRADAGAADVLGDLTLHARVILDPRGLTAGMHPRQSTRPVQPPALLAREHDEATLGVARALHHAAVVLEPHDARQRHMQDPRHLLGDDREQPRRLSLLRHKRRHPP